MFAVKKATPAAAPETLSDVAAVVEAQRIATEFSDAERKLTAEFNALHARAGQLAQQAPDEIAAGRAAIDRAPAVTSLYEQISETSERLERIRTARRRADTDVLRASQEASARYCQTRRADLVAVAQKRHALFALADQNLRDEARLRADIQARGFSDGTLPFLPSMAGYSDDASGSGAFYAKRELEAFLGLGNY